MTFVLRAEDEELLRKSLEKKGLADDDIEKMMDRTYILRINEDRGFAVFGPTKVGDKITNPSISVGLDTYFDLIE